MNPWKFLILGLSLSVYSAHAADWDGYYQGKYVDGRLQKKEQEKLEIWVKTTEILPDEVSGEKTSLTLALILKTQSQQAGIFVVDTLPDGTQRWRALGVQK